MDWDAADVDALIGEVRHLRTVVERADVEDARQLERLLADVEDALQAARDEMAPAVPE